MKYICPLIAVSDIARARFLYEEILRQKVKLDYGENITFEGGFALHQKAHFQELLNKPVVSGSNSFELYFEENDLETLAARLKEHGFEFVHDIKEQPWRQKVFRFYDYDKNLIEIGESLDYTAYRLFKEGMDLSKITQTLYITPEAVQKAVKNYS